jgi:large subunit ribosomal protein L24
MASMKIKKGDKVVILSGKDKGKHGEVTKAFPSANKILVSGINMITRHVKPTQANPQGGKQSAEAPLHVSNVAIEDPKTGKPTRVRFEIQGDKKVRVAVKSGQVL